MPADAEVLRLTCADLDGWDVGTLQSQLANLSGVEGVAIDLYERTVDLFVDPRRASPPHLVALASERLGLPVEGAELHRRAGPGAKLGNESRILVLF